MTINEIVRDYYKKEYPESDGICEPDLECGCGYDDFAPCGYVCDNCQLAKYNEETGFYEVIE